MLDNAKLCGMVGRPNGQVAIQRNLDRLEVQENILRFNKSNFRVLLLDPFNSHYQYNLGDKGIEQREMASN